MVQYVEDSGLTVHMESANVQGLDESFAELPFMMSRPPNWRLAGADPHRWDTNSTTQGAASDIPRNLIATLPTITLPPTSTDCTPACPAVRMGKDAPLQDLHPRLEEAEAALTRAHEARQNEEERCR